jgi:type III secretion system low calcium response chaperone LcrH/SycD
MSETVTVGDLPLGELTPMQQKALEVLSAGGTLKDVRGLSKEDIETIYAIGYNLYNQAQYDKAEPMFQFACFYQHTEARYWVALGNCRQMAKNYQPAIDAYGFGYALDQANPWPVIQAAICYLALQDKGQAAEALTLAEQTIENSTPNEAARQRIAALRQAL